MGTEAVIQKHKAPQASRWMERLRLVKSFQFTTRLTPEECVEAIQEIARQPNTLARYDAEFISDGEKIRFDFVHHNRRSRKNDVNVFIRGEIQNEPNMYLTRVSGKVYPSLIILLPLIFLPFIMIGVLDYGLRFVAGQLAASQIWFLFIGVIFVIVIALQAVEPGRGLLRYFLQEMEWAEKRYARRGS